MLKASDVLPLMRNCGADGLTEASVERHLQKRAALHEKLAAMMPTVDTSAGPVIAELPPSPLGEAPAQSPTESMQRQQALQRKLAAEQRSLQMQFDEGLATTS